MAVLQTREGLLSHTLEFQRLLTQNGQHSCDTKLSHIQFEHSAHVERYIPTAAQ